MTDSSTPNPSDQPDRDQAERPRIRLKLKPIGQPEKTEPQPAPPPPPQPPQPDPPPPQPPQPPPPPPPPQPEPRPQPEPPEPPPPLAPPEPEPPHPEVRHTVRRLAWILAPAAIVAVALLILLWRLDPLGSDLTPIEAPTTPAPRRSEAAPVFTEPSPGEAVQPEAPAAPEGALLADFIAALQGAQIVPSESPRGTFIDGIFFAEGAMLHPGSGLMLESVSLEAEPPELHIRDSQGRIHAVPLITRSN